MKETEKNMKHMTPEEKVSYVSNLIEETTESFIVGLYRDTLSKNFTEIQKLRETVAKLNRNEIKLRDKIAANIYMQIYKDVPTAEKATEDAYVAADTFMKVRNAASELTLLEDIQFLIDNIDGDTALGAKIRILYAKKQK